LVGEAAVQALHQLASLERLGLLLVGVVAGLLVGMLPGLGGITAVSIVLGFALRQDPAAAVAVLLGAAAVVHTSDTITSVLLGIPGSAASTVSAIEGYRLTRAGEAARALAGAFAASVVGGLVGAIGLTFAIPVGRPLVLSLGMPELFMLTVLGVVYAGTLLGRDRVKGMLAGCMGLVLGTVGRSPLAAQFRFDFGWTYLMDGIPLGPLALGLFGIPEVVWLLAERGQIARRHGIGGGWARGLRDVWRHRWVVLRGALVGLWAGLLPILGPVAGALMAYGQAKASRRGDREAGGAGLAGMLAAEAANNATFPGDLVPTILFGVPGSVAAAIVVGALLRWGIYPGPRILNDHLELIYVMVWSYALATMAGAILCFGVSPLVARITNVRVGLAAPPIVLLLLVGAYAANSELGDVAILLGAGLLGVGLKLAGWPRAPLLIGFVLALPLERYLGGTMALYGWRWLLRPGVLLVAGVIAAPFVWKLLRTRPRVPRKTAGSHEAGALAPDSEEEGEEAEEGGQGSPQWDLGLTAAAGLSLLAAAAFATALVPGARELPLLGGLVGLVLAWGRFARLWRSKTWGSSLRAAQGQPAVKVVEATAWVAALAAASALVGLRPAAVLWSCALSVFVGKLRPMAGAAYGLLVTVLVDWVARVSGLVLPSGLLLNLW
jgi:putative tricarboxylic transport membrane protein